MKTFVRKPSSSSANIAKAQTPKLAFFGGPFLPLLIVAGCSWLTAQADQMEPSNSQNEETQSWRFEAGIYARAVRDDNVFIQPIDPKTDTYFQIAPVLALGQGNFLDELISFAPIPHFMVQNGEEEFPYKNFSYITYSPEFLRFAKYHDENAVNHDARVAIRRESELWNWHGQFHFQKQTAPNIDVGRRLAQTFYTLESGAEHELSAKVKATGELHADRTEYAGGNNSTDAHAGGGIDYQIAPKTSVGGQIVGGYLDVANGSDQTYEQALFKLKYTPDGKLVFIGQAGGELRQYNNIGDRTHFVFDVSGGYQATEGTLITVAVFRKTTASAQYSGENIVATTYKADVRQRLLRRFYLSLSGGFVNNNYENNRPALSINRTDDYYYGKGSLAFDFTRHGTIELFYEYRKNDSSLASFAFNENLAGVSAAFLF